MVDPYRSKLISVVIAIYAAGMCFIHQDMIGLLIIEKYFLSLTIL